MFSSFSEKFNNIISSVKGKAVISEKDLEITLREIRVALLEADVSLSVVKSFINNIRDKIIGQSVLKNLQPSQMIIKLVHDQLVEILGSKKHDINLDVKSPAIIMFCGLQGSGKTTSVAKVAKLLKARKKKIALLSTDIYRPAAQEQLETLSKEIDIDFIKNFEEKNITKIINNALKIVKKELYDIMIIDTAGRQVIDISLMNELENISNLTSPCEKILVADSLTGQDAANVASKFHEKINITGIMLTRIDGDSRGGAAMSIKSVTGAPIKYLGIGEKIDQIEEFYPERIANRILGMGDVVSLVEKVAGTIKNEDLENLEKKFSSGKFNLSDFSKQLKQMKKIGGVSGMLSMLPGISQKQKNMVENNVNEDIIEKQIAIINSMTKKERSNPEIIKASRKIRISNGSGTKVQEVNKLLKQFMNSQKMMKKMKKIGSRENPLDLMNKLKGNIPTNFNN